MAKNTYFYGLGRRKAATARARLMGGKGNITINGKTAAEYFQNNTSMLAELTDPLAAIGKQKEFDVTLVIRGGGPAGQVDAAKLAISKSISIM
ncbi:MAG: 30S ribosomal protein S9, partial [Candidatus Saccharimonadales bacterium]